MALARLASEELPPLRTCVSCAAQLSPHTSGVAAAAAPHDVPMDRGLLSQQLARLITGGAVHRMSGSSSTAPALHDGFSRQLLMLGGAASYRSLGSCSTAPANTVADTSPWSPSQQLAQQVDAAEALRAWRGVLDASPAPPYVPAYERCPPVVWAGAATLSTPACVTVGATQLGNTPRSQRCDACWAAQRERTAQPPRTCSLDAGGRTDRRANNSSSSASLPACGMACMSSAGTSTCMGGAEARISEAPLVQSGAPYGMYPRQQSDCEGARIGCVHIPLYEGLLASPPPVPPSPLGRVSELTSSSQVGGRVLHMPLTQLITGKLCTEPC